MNYEYEYEKYKAYNSVSLLDRNALHSLTSEREQSSNSDACPLDIVPKELLTSKRDTHVSPDPAQADRDPLDLLTSLRESVKILLDKYGVVIIPNVLNKEEQQNMMNGMWDMFEHLTQNWTKGSDDDYRIKRYDKNSWLSLFDLEPTNNMMYQKWNIGHAQHLWDLRMNIKIVNIFADIWDVKPEELLVSFDGLSFLPPPEETDIGWSDGDTWFHLDQTVTKPYFDGIQGWITGVDVQEGDGSLLFYEGSHKLIENFVEHFGIRTKSDWVLLKEDEDEFFKERCEMKAIKCPAGSLVIWDSRTVHCGMGPIKDRKNDNFRCISYLSYSPRSKCDKETLKEKIKGFNEMKTSNHYANRATFFPTLSNKLNKYDINELVTPLEKPVLNELGKCLVGKSSPKGLQP